MSTGVVIRLEVPTAAEMRALGGRLAGLLRRGDLVVLTGDLGAGKTTLTQGLGAALGVRGRICSPTFVISRVHPSEVGGPALVHADTYRMADAAEVADLDLDESMPDSVTVVEWGAGLVEALSTDRLELVLSRRAERPVDADPDDPSAAIREVSITAVGARWAGVELTAALLP
ncbi:MAG TPA: tRNA (adenosine(37)-N6)-threonylcarbamoyltransferase complex ATPase subunit type 1 TsaE [Sporichthyaceae bacterium]|nr:tRNA (adenosine(37)-N6)-threonylcarbamoyltransferase complex ATPase subunit type 1 TsaE [Sporichthyaceae bacterium]